MATKKAAPKVARAAAPVIAGPVAAQLKRDQAEIAEKRAALDVLQQREAEQRAAAAARLEAQG